MYTSFIKTTLIICFLSIFSTSYVLAMDEEDRPTSIKTHKTESPNKQDSLAQEEKKCCPHWGLTRWLYGIKEYMIDRCLLGGKDFNAQDSERAYVLRRQISSEHYEIIHSSDCRCCVCADGSYDPTPGYNKIFTYTLCCPIITMMHMVCLPFQCCYCERDQTLISYTPGPSTVTSNTKENVVERKRAEEERVKNMSPEEREAYYKMQSLHHQTVQSINSVNYQNYNYWNNIYPNN